LSIDAQSSATTRTSLQCYLQASLMQPHHIISNQTTTPADTPAAAAQ
jgi:hypothetical protein